MRCVWCGKEIRFEPGRGWVHAEGGAYVLRCPECGWTGAPYPAPERCPRCGSPRLRDDHRALPNFAEERR